MTKVFVVVSLLVAGVHSWAGCNIPAVGYLSNIHRHVFYIRLVKQVAHTNRDIEILQLKQKVETFLKEAYPANLNKEVDFGNSSCEQVAEKLLLHFGCAEVQVLEDNENGAIVQQEQV